MQKFLILTALLTLTGCAAPLATVEDKSEVGRPLPAPSPRSSRAGPPAGHGFAIFESNSIPGAPAKQEQPYASRNHTQHNVKVSVANTYNRVPSVDEATEQITQQLFETSVGIVSKTETEINQSFTLTLIVDPSKNKQELTAQLQSANLNQLVDVSKTKISSLAWPNLIAPDFIVEPVTAAEQPITKDSETSWSWQLKPQAEGNFSVIVELYAIVYVGDQKTRKKYKTLSQNITVTVPPVSKTTQIWNWIDSKWDWLWSVLIIPLIGYIWSRVKKKSKD
jgi:hypothetical protein